MSVVCGAMFGEEGVNNSVDLLSRVFITFFSRSNFSIGCCNNFYKSKRRLCLQLPHQHGSQMAQLCSPQDYLFFSRDVERLTTLLLQLAVTDAWMLSNVQTRTPRLLSFRDEPTLRQFCTYCGPIFKYFPAYHESPRSSVVRMSDWCTKGHGIKCFSLFHT